MSWTRKGEGREREEVKGRKDGMERSERERQDDVDEVGTRLEDMDANKASPSPPVAPVLVGWVSVGLYESRGKGEEAKEREEGRTASARCVGERGE